MKNSTYIAWVAMIIAILALGYGVTHSSSPPSQGGNGSRFPNGLSADTTLPNAGQLRGTTLTITGASSFGGGTSIASAYNGTCNIGVISSQTFTATSSINATCGSGTNGATALTGITSTSKIVLVAPTTTPLTSNGIVMLAAGASTTAGFIQVVLSNLTGANYTWASTASTSWQYFVFN